MLGRLLDEVTNVVKRPLCLVPGHEWRRNGSTGAIVCKHCGARRNY